MTGSSIDRTLHAASSTRRVAPRGLAIFLTTLLLTSTVTIGAFAAHSDGSAYHHDVTGTLTLHGEPPVDALVHLELWQFDESRVVTQVFAPSTLDEETGSYAFAGVEGGVYSVAAWIESTGDAAPSPGETYGYYEDETTPAFDLTFVVDASFDVPLIAITVPEEPAPEEPGFNVTGTLTFVGEPPVDAPVHLELWQFDEMGGVARAFAPSTLDEETGSYAFLGVEGGAYSVAAWIDSTNDGVPGPGEAYGYYEPRTTPSFDIAFTVNASYEVPLIAITVPEEPAPEEPGLNVTGTLAYEGNATGPFRVELWPVNESRAVIPGAPDGSAFAFTNVPPDAYALAAWLDSNATEGLQEDEPVGYFTSFGNADEPTLAQAWNLTEDVHFDVTLVDPALPPDDGADAPDDGTSEPPAVAVTVAGSVSYEGAANGSLHVELWEDGDSAIALTPVFEENGTFTFVNVTPGNWSLAAWIDTNETPGPQHDEPVGFASDEPDSPSHSVLRDVHADWIGFTVTIEDPCTTRCSDPGDEGDADEPARICVACPDAAGSDDPRASPWGATASYPAGIEGATGAWIGNAFYVTQGHTSSRAGSFDVNWTYRYDPGTDAWTRVADAPIAFAEGAGVAIGDTLYSFGGRNRDTCGLCPNTTIYDAATDSWSEGAPVPTPRAGHGVVHVDGSIYVIGGRNETQPTHGESLRTVEIYDPSTDSWSVGPDMPLAVSEATAVAALDGFVYVFGGYGNATYADIGLTQILDVARGTWSYGVPMPTPRYGAAAAVCGGKIFVIGGVMGGYGSRTSLGTVQSFDPTTYTWDVHPDLPRTASQVAGTGISDDGLIMLVGSGIHGVARSQSFIADCAALDPPPGGSGDPDTGDGDEDASVTVNGRIGYDGTFTDTLRVRLSDGVWEAVHNGTAPGAFEFTGVPGNAFHLVAWLEENGHEGPQADEALGFLATDSTELAHNVTLDTTTGDVTMDVVILDAPEGGWPQDYLAGEPAPDDGSGGGVGDCSATSGGTVSGFILDESGNVPEGAFLDVQNDDTGTGEFPGFDDTGYYSCALVPGNYTIRSGAEDAGFAEERFTLHADENLTVNLTLSFDFRPAYQWPSTFYGGTVWGNVTLSDGSPLEAVRVNLFPAWDPDSPTSGECDPGDASTLTLGTCGGEGESNANGTFVITGMGNGTFDLFVDGAAAGAGSAFTPSAVIVTNASGSMVTHVADLDLSFEPPAHIRGNVTDSLGNPVANAMVDAWGENGGGHTQTDSNGSYELAVNPGTYGMHVSAPSDWPAALSPSRVDCFPGSPDCVVIASGDVAWVDHALAAGARVTGRVVDAFGGDVRANLQADAIDAFGHHAFGAWGQTDWESGWFNLTLEPGTYDVRIEPDRFDHPDLSTRTLRGVNVTAGSTMDLGVLALGAGSRIVGYVTDAAGNPVADANLFSMEHVDDPFAPPGGPGGWANSRSDGSYQFTGVAAGVYDVLVEAPYGSGLMSAEHRALNVTPGAWTWLNVTLGAGGSITGFVTGPDGEPVPFASVDAFWMPEVTAFTSPSAFPAAGGWGHAQSDANGRFTISGLADGTFGMSVRPPPGSAFTSAHVDHFTGGGPLAVSVGTPSWMNFTLGAGGAITGRLVDADGTPVVNAWVNAFSPASGFGGGEASRGDGSFTIRGVAPGSYTVEAMPPLGSDLTRGVTSASVTPGATVDVGDLTLTRGVRFAGRVLDDAGDPVPGAHVSAFQLTGGPGAPGAFSFGMTNANGAFNLSGLVPGKYGFRVDPPLDLGLGSKEVMDVRVGEGGRFDYTVELGGGGWILGRVVDPDGNGIRGAFVGAWSPDSGSGAGSATNATGWFNLTGLEPGSGFSVDVFPPFARSDLAGRHVFPVSVNASEGTDVGILALGTGGALTGTVLKSDGSPAANAFVNVGGNGTFGWGMTDADGAFRVPGLTAAPGDALDVFVEPGHLGGFSPTRATVTWSPDADGSSAAGNITVGAGVNVTGVIVNAGAGVAGAEVHVMPCLPYFGPPIGGFAETDEDGAFTVTGLADGCYDVAVRPVGDVAGWFQQAALNVTGNATSAWLNVTLDEGAHLRVSVLDAATGSAIDGALVEAFNPALFAGDANETAADGNASLRSLPAGTYKVKAHAPGYAPARVNATLVAGEQSNVTFLVNAITPSDLEGVFTPASGGASGLFVVATPVGGVGDDDATGFAATAASGAFTLRDLPPDAYRVKVIDGAGAELACKVADLSSGDVTDFAIAHGEEC